MNDFVVGALSSIGAIGIIGGTAAFFYRPKNTHSAKERLLARQYSVMTDSAERELPMEILASPALISSRMEFRKIEAIEAELIHKSDIEIAQRLLKSFFKGDDPWVSARAAKALYALDSKTALHELKALIANASSFVQIPGIWALGEVATPAALDMLIPLIDNKNQKIQEAVIRSLLQIEIKQRIPPESLARVGRLLKELRFKMDWIL